MKIKYKCNQCADKIDNDKKSCVVTVIESDDMLDHSHPELCLIDCDNVAFWEKTK